MNQVLQCIIGLAGAVVVIGILVFVCPYLIIAANKLLGIFFWINERTERICKEHGVDIGGDYD